MRKIVILLSISVFLVTGYFLVQSQNAPHFNNLGDYLQFKGAMSSQERFDLSTVILQNAGDEAISLEAVRDLVRLSQSLQKDDEALTQIDNLLKKMGKESPLERNALLAKARLLRRLGQKKEGDAIYRKACGEKWDNSYTDYRDSLSETGEDDKRAANIHNGWFAYRNEKDLFYFADALKRYKTKNPQDTVLEKVLPQLSDSPEHPQIHRLAEALCLTIDEKYGDALALFDAIENEFRKTEDRPLSTTDEFYKENENLPLYKALCLLLEGRDFNAARLNISNYLEKSQSSPRWQAERIMNDVPAKSIDVAIGRLPIGVQASCLQYISCRLEVRTARN